MKNKPSEAPRRSFLKTARSLGVLGAAASLLGRGSSALAKAPLAPAISAVPESGYHESEHIRKYYAAARYF